MSTVTLSLVQILPDDPLRLILSWLRPHELAVIAQVCKYLKELSDEVASDIFKILQSSLFPMTLKSNPLKSLRESGHLKRLLHGLSKTQIYTIGGAFNSDQVNCFVPSSCKLTWYAAGDCEEDRESSAVTSVRGYIVSVSGEGDDCASTAEIFSPIENAWASLPSLECGVQQTACVSIDDNVLVIGGRDVNSESPVAVIQKLGLNLSKSKLSNLNGWTCCDGVLADARYGHAAVVYNDEIYVAGGTTEDETYSATVEVLSYENGHVVHNRKVSSMVHGRKNFQLVVINDRLYAVGGDHADENVSIECYDLENDRWEIVSTFPTYRQHFACVTDGEMIYVFGGQSRRRQFSSSWDCYNPSTNVWSESDNKLPSNQGFSHGSAVTLNFANMSW